MVCLTPRLAGFLFGDMIYGDEYQPNVAGGEFAGLRVTGLA
jgi:hypothetical protein